MTYLLLKRAYDNFGDYLIFERAQKIISNINKDIVMIYGDAGRPLESQFDKNTLKNLKGVIIPGGPGVVSDMYPKIYPLSPIIFSNKIPIYMLGVGSFFSNNLKKIQPITQSTKYFLSYVNEFAPIGCRDIFTKNYLEQLGFNSVVNGCPAWYDLNFFGERIQTVKVKNVLFSVPGSRVYFEQFIKIVEYFLRNYPQYNYHISFNHGIKKEPFLTLKNKLAGKNVNILDMSGNTNNSFKYNDMDLHIGYRVHTHIYFLSRRKLTILLAEDSRGIGIMETLKTLGIQCWKDDDYLLKYKLKINNKFGRNIFKVSNDEQVIDGLKCFLKNLNPVTYNEVFTQMEEYYKNMQSFIKQYIK
jgi:hypothetical protein